MPDLFDFKAQRRRAAMAEKDALAWHGGALDGRPDAERVRAQLEKMIPDVPWPEVWAAAGPPSGDADETFGRVARVLDARAARPSSSE